MAIDRADLPIKHIKHCDFPQLCAFTRGHYYIRGIAHSLSSYSRVGYQVSDLSPYRDGMGYSTIQMEKRRKTLKTYETETSIYPTIYGDCPCRFQEDSNLVGIEWEITNMVSHQHKATIRKI